LVLNEIDKKISSDYITIINDYSDKLHPLVMIQKIKKS
jgi:hypothetical protein